MSASVQYFVNPERILPQLQKKVRFADACPKSGVEFTSVKIITPNNSNDNLFSIFKEKEPLPVNHMKCQFPLEKDLEALLQKVKHKKVCLENILCSQFAVLGLIRVQNLHFKKDVIVRYTTDNWRTYRDIWSDYVSSAPDKSSDKFTFRITLHCWLFNDKQNIEFAIRYKVNGKEYWDNNDGLNYLVKCYSERSIFR